ncbi:MAG: hypothetical protein HOY79_34115 [Streptomyces sp.]|nr:hypothetical protein [Streptomyces sp.]NUS11406.1 hypothetical protein [Streptomyces sp.]NUS23453.1 hypothetical protein [Streptomyces sp.]
MPSRRPYAVECEDFRSVIAYPHGAPLLWNGVLQAAWRDASFLRRPDVRSIKARHVIVASHQYNVGSGLCGPTAACDPRNILIDVALRDDATKVHRNGRCRRPGCRQLFADAARIASSVEHIRNYYGLAVYGGMRVKHEGRPGTIVGYRGQYIEVLIGGEDRPITCHATAEMEYPEEARVGPGPDERFAHLVQVPRT